MSILNYLRKLRKLKITHNDEVSSFKTSLWKLISGPLSLLFIPLFINPEEQGFWYTFSGLSALAIFADLGFTIIILQFSAHEFAFLKLENGKLIGNDYHLARISSLFKFVLRWNSIMIVIVFPIIAVLGIVMFSDKSDSSYWLIPWIIYMVASIGTFTCSVVSSFLQGCEQVGKIQRIMLYSGVATTIVLLPLLYLNFGLYSLAISFLLGTFVYIFLLYKEYNKLILQLLHHNKLEGNWNKELLPLLGKYAISWSSGYFSFQIYTPLMFQYNGAIEAGKVGITMSLINAIYSISRIWLTAKTPKLNILVAEKKWVDLDKLFKQIMILSASTYLLGIVSIFAAFLILSGHWNLFDHMTLRFLGIIPLSMLSLGWFFQLFVSGAAAYLRAHKKEVYLQISVISGLFVVLSTLLSVHYLPGDYLFLGFLTSFFVFGIIFYNIFNKYRASWHQNY